MAHGLRTFPAHLDAGEHRDVHEGPQYRAVAQVLIKNARAYPEVSPTGRVATVDRLPNETIINSEMQLLRSSDLLRRVHFELAAEAKEEGDDDRRIPTTTALEQKIMVSRKPNSNVLEVAYRSTDQEEAIHVVNTLVRLYVDFSIEKHREPGAVEFFYQQAAAAKETFEQADLQLERYDAANGLTSIAVEKDHLLRQRAQLEADLRRSEAEITELTTKVAALEAELEFIPEHEATEVDMVPNPMLNFLRQNLARLEMERVRLEQLYTPSRRRRVSSVARSSRRPRFAGRSSGNCSARRLSSVLSRRGAPCWASAFRITMRGFA